MNFKKYLTIENSLQGQAALEYFIVFSLIALLTILSFSSFDESVGDSTGNFSQDAIARILQ
mgnify:CR=1 FL=1